MTVSLPDVNVLLALAWPNHQFHGAAHDWYRESHERGWATCAVTQLGFVRLSSNPAFSPHATTPVEATRVLRQLIAQRSHRFVAELGAPTEEPFFGIAPRLQGYRQITDAYLISVALARKLTLVTFDRRLRHVSPRPAALRVLSPA